MTEKELIVEKMKEYLQSHADRAVLAKSSGVVIREIVYVLADWALKARVTDIRSDIMPEQSSSFLDALERIS